MDAMPSDLLMQVEGMTCDGCAAAVRRTIQHLDPDARVAVDLEHGCVAVTTTAQALTIAEALTEAGYTARAMTG
jgi:copper chaperone